MKIILKKINISLMKLMTKVSPEINFYYRYYRLNKKFPNIKNPTSLEEKLIKLQVENYLDNKEIPKLVDKYQVKNELEKIGLGDLIIKNLSVIDDLSGLEFDLLPTKFILKMNFGAGMNYICKDKEKLDYTTFFKTVSKWYNSEPWLVSGELQYSKYKKRIIIEELLEMDESDVLVDYKVYCFNGKPKAILVMHDRFDCVKAEFFDENWKFLGNPSKYEAPDNITKSPLCLKQMINVAEQLSENFPFVRCDFYIHNEKLYFGELTFSPAGCVGLAEISINGSSMGSILEL